MRREYIVVVERWTDGAESLTEVHRTDDIEDARRIHRLTAEAHKDSPLTWVFIDIAEEE